MEHSNSSTYFLSSYTTPETAIFAATLICIIVMSMIGGITMLYILYCNDKMWNSTNMLIGNLAFTSTCVTTLVMPFSLLSVVKRKWTFGEGYICKLNGFAASLLLLATVFTHTVISIDKYFAVVRPMSRMMTVRKTAFFILGIWTMASAMSLVPLTGISSYVYNPTTLICGVGFPRRKTDLVYLLTLAGVGFVLPMNIMTYVYTRVYFAVKQHTARLLAHAVMSTDVLVLQKKLILTVFASFICFLICWSTFFMLTIAALVVKDGSELPHGLGVAAYWTGYLNSALNPVIICSMSNRFKQGSLEIYRNFLGFFRVSCTTQSIYLKSKKQGKQAVHEMMDVSSGSTYGTYTLKNRFTETGLLEEQLGISNCMKNSGTKK